MAFRANSSSNVPTTTPRVIPAQVNFLTIYNPTLGDTEETEPDQIVFWAGKDELGTSRPGRKPSKEQDSDPEINGSNKGKTEEQIVNERLRQIGLARGMVEFARNFATGRSLDTIETDRSRIVLHELEKDWWILASIDLTRLPIAALKAKTQNDPKQPQLQYEFSAREVSPATLLRTQLLKAHNLFLLHHSATLWELYHKLGRMDFGVQLTRYWETFARRWDVLLHGNPAVDVYGDCVKLAGGGELGVGVGEEEWGSGEREVLEGFVERVEGLIECVVGRYGSAPEEKSKRKIDEEKLKKLGLEEKIKLGREIDAGPWLGAGEDSSPADGIIFSGMGTISRKSLATVSQWMEAMFKHGDSAYGVGENPASRSRQKRQKTKRPQFERKVSEEQSRKFKDEQSQDREIHPGLKSPKNKSPDWRRKAIENNAAPPGIPAPLVGAVERSLDDALAKVARRGDSKSPRSSPKSSPTQQKTQEEAMEGFSNTKEEASVFSMEGMKNIFSFGYGSSWTLNRNGFDSKEDKLDKSKPKVKEQPAKRSAESPGVQTPPERRPPLHRSKSSGSRPATERLQEIDPNPEFSDEDIPFVQKLEQSIGKFIIGLSGDLENQEFDDSDEPLPANNSKRRPHTQRIFLRTLTIELANAHYNRPALNDSDRTISQASNLSRGSATSTGSVRSTNGPEPKTSAAASVDGARPISRHEKVRVAVYIHQPFIFVFLFELHTANLTMPAFYRAIHHQLGPLQKPLLQRTDPARVAQRIESVLNANSSAAMSAVKKHIDVNGNAIYDLVYDPSKNTIRTSIPNIPIPTSPDSVIKSTATVSGSWYTLGIPIGTSNSPSTRLDVHNTKSKLEPWSRIEALNVHTQILNSYISTRIPTDLERTVKTAKGWWVLWMKVSSPNKESEELKEAFLVRKSADFTPAGAKSRDGARSASNSGTPASRWLLRDQPRDTNSASHTGATALTGAKGVSEGVGIDARKWVEGLLSLTQ